MVAGDPEISASILGTFNLGEGRFSGLNEAIHAVVLSDRLSFLKLHIRKRISQSRKEEAHSHHVIREGLKTPSMFQRDGGTAKLLEHHRRRARRQQDQELPPERP